MGQGGKGPAQRQCQALNRKGEPCGARPVIGSDFCHLHGAPERAKELGRKGGRFFAQLKVLPEAAYTLDSPQAVAGCLGDVVNAVLSGRLDHRIGNTVAVLAGQLVRAQEAGELEKRLAALEEKLLGEKRP